MAIMVLYWVITLSCWTYALARGGRPARWAFKFFLLATLLTTIATWPDATFSLSDWHRLNVLLLLADGFYLVALYVMALVCRRYWLIWSAGFQLVCTLTHFGPMIDPFTSAKIYRGLESVWVLPMLITMVIGIHRDRAAIARGRFYERSISDRS